MFRLKRPKIRIMRYLLLFLAAPFLSVYADAPDCARLKKIANVLEDKMEQQRFKAPEYNCSEMTAKDFGLPDGQVGFNKEDEWDYRCKDLSSIDAQLKSIENEIALLNGIAGLKNDINQGVVTLKKFTNPEVAKEATNKFMKNLAVAQSLELFLGTNNGDSKNILSELVKADPKEWESLSSFAKLIEKFCKANPIPGDSVCMKGFVLTQDVFEEINGFVKLGSETSRKFNKRQVNELSDALGIKKGKEKYSFNQLAHEVKVSENGLFSKADLQKLKELPPLSNSTKFDFLKDIKSSMKDLKDSEELVGAQEIPAKFSSLLNDLKKRQQFEMKSKLSLVLFNNADKIPEDLKDKCSQAKELSISISECLEPLSKISGLNETQAMLNDYNQEFTYGEAHVAKLDELLKDCIPDESLEYPAKCEGMITKNMAALVNKANTLSAMRAKLLLANPGLTVLRNFALEQLESNECMSAGESNIGECSQDVGTISREVVTLSGDAGDVLHLFARSEAETDISGVCAERSEKVPHTDELCVLYEEGLKKKKTSTSTNLVDNANLNPQGPGNGEAIGDFLKSVGLTVANYYRKPPQQYNTNPYAPIYPYAPMINQQPQDISQKIMGPYMAAGYGSYSPGPGLRPYSSVNSNVTTYAGYSFGSSSHFNSPVGW